MVGMMGRRDRGRRKVKIVLLWERGEGVEEVVV